MHHRALASLLIVTVCVLACLVFLPGSWWIPSAAAQTLAVPATPSARADSSRPSGHPDLLDAGSNRARSGAALELEDAAAAQTAGVSPAVLTLATSAVRCAVASGDITPPPTLTLIDYSRPSTEPRLWVFDLHTGQLRFRELVAHGKGTGENLARHFSDDPDSHQSSLGLFVTSDTYTGHNGYSLRLDGLEPGFNSRARARAIVMHGAPYVDAAVAAKQGRLGRSWGCPALRTGIAHQVIDLVRGGGVIFAYYPDQAWLEQSRFLHCPATSPETTLASTR